MNVYVYSKVVQLLNSPATQPDVESDCFLYALYIIRSVMSSAKASRIQVANMLSLLASFLFTLILYVTCRLLLGILPNKVSSHTFTVI